MNTALAIALVVALTGAGQSSVPEKRLSARAALAQIRSNGPAAFINAYEHSAAWDRDILAGIEDADSSWLMAAKLLKPHADGAVSEEIGLALYGALPKRPFAVIPVLMQVYRSTAEEVCTQTFEAATPPQGVDSYLSQLEKALSRARSRTEIDMANQCREGVVATRNYVRDTLKK
ncbi:hypothetical protein LNV09_24465 [Paucibacter sp. B2R-40]|uniref:hypothetical protein n=1 Tax=Paucibacter sp. B2R-40 TaxID=2893554 RepID=UPI0021E36D5A|nr:hypothetical protein [Paucibacter sp. B2R-40]MCV2357311.1 hypothetical protein [Paucibacter sp. B2R-40]